MRCRAALGAHDERLVDAVEGEVDQLKPDLVVISGDFTQRARTEQFREAYSEYFDFVNDRRNGLRTMTLPFEGGLEFTVRETI